MDSIGNLRFDNANYFIADVNNEKLHLAVKILPPDSVQTQPVSLPYASGDTRFVGI